MRSANAASAHSISLASPRFLIARARSTAKESRYGVRQRLLVTFLKEIRKRMINFHKRLREQSSAVGGPRANALRQAALDVMKDPRYRHPFFWAGFVMIGS